MTVHSLHVTLIVLRNIAHGVPVSNFSF